jgi:hypothetical protein
VFCGKERLYNGFLSAKRVLNAFFYFLCHMNSTASNIEFGSAQPQVNKWLCSQIRELKDENLKLRDSRAVLEKNFKDLQIRSDEQSALILKLSFAPLKNASSKDLRVIEVKRYGPHRPSLSKLFFLTIS